ncbi:MAG: hypothetical protein BMS9Abin36_0799 [Gammaproteobacteria bacterium]|nr:MAG: hypothetical protein BMS9Abin36_0799 [Gammaproteobacteria bacterium]
MARITIYVPDNVKERMDEWEDVNWSQTAVQAFEIKMGELAQTLKEKTMEQVIDRLRASKLKSGNEEYQTGYKNGMEWAKGYAETVHLDMLGDLSEGINDWEEWCESSKYTAYSPSEHLISNIVTEIDYDREMAKDQWTSILGEPENYPLEWKIIDKPDFLRGFTDGALAIYEKVIDQL